MLLKTVILSLWKSRTGPVWELSRLYQPGLVGGWGGDADRENSVWIYFWPDTVV